jgi:farnesyl diphosphate synthase
MTSFFFNQSLQEYEQYLQAFLEDLTIPDTILKEAIHYVLATPSKKIRAKMVYSAGFLYQLPSTLLNPIALAIELIHAYSLVHDDLPAMDNDDWRRGKPSCHIAFNEAIAILTGNALHHLAISHLLDTLPQATTKTNTIAILQTILTHIGTQGILSGQSMDLRLLSQKDLSLSTLTQIHHLKTTALLQAILESIWILSSQIPHDKDVLKSYARHFGLAYQMLDDYGDQYASHQWGKQHNSDSKNQKNTFVSFYSQTELKEHIRSELSLAKSNIKTLPHHEYLYDLVQQIENRLQTL